MKATASQLKTAAARMFIPRNWNAFGGASELMRRVEALRISHLIVTENGVTTTISFEILWDR